MSALSRDKGDKIKCYSCNNLYYRKCTKVNHTVALSQSNNELYAICEEDTHTYKTKTSEDRISKG